MIIFIIIAVIIITILEVNKKLSSKQFISDLNPYFKFLMEDDYVFLVGVRYGGDVDVEKLFNMRLRDGFLTIALVLLLSLSRLNFVFVLAAVILGFVVFKLPYFKLTSYYKKNLYTINLMLPYYLKSLEILIQHYTVPVAMARSIDTAPDIFKPGLQRLVEKIEAGNSTVDPYMDFAKEYPVRDSMRMMRLLYRLSLGAQENKQTQLEQFSKTVSTLQNKSREQKYKDRLDTMEKKTMIMLVATGGGVLLLLFMSLTMMINF